MVSFGDGSAIDGNLRERPIGGCGIVLRLFCPGNKYHGKEVQLAYQFQARYATALVTEAGSLFISLRLQFRQLVGHLTAIHPSERPESVLLMGFSDCQGLLDALKNGKYVKEKWGWHVVYNHLLYQIALLSKEIAECDLGTKIDLQLHWTLGHADLEDEAHDPQAICDELAKGARADGSYSQIGKVKFQPIQGMMDDSLMQSLDMLYAACGLPEDGQQQTTSNNGSEKRKAEGTLYPGPSKKSRGFQPARRARPSRSTRRPVGVVIPPSNTPSTTTWNPLSYLRSVGSARVVFSNGIAAGFGFTRNRFVFIVDAAGIVDAVPIWHLLALP